MRTLIAEDDPVSRKLLEAQLRKWGHQVVACTNGYQAWEILRQEDAPSFVILDWVMPEMDGVSVCREVRRLEKKSYTYIILLTAKSGKDDIVAGLEAGADDYIVKPFDPNELKVRVRAGSRIVQLQDDLRSAVAASEYQASHDALTRLWNRAAILNIVQRELERGQRNVTPVAVIMADVDHFKRINDEHGHLAGDAVLRDVAQRITSLLRMYDSVGRYGGEEFIIVVPDCHKDEAIGTAERLRSEFAENPCRTTEGTFNITISFGVTTAYGSTGWDVEALIRAADEALYRAKQSGRNRVAI